GVNASGLLNALVDILSPYDAVGHGSHVVATAAGTTEFQLLSMASTTGEPVGWRHAIKDRVDILSLSIGPDTPPKKTLTMLSMFDIFMLFARKAGVLVIQAAGNRGSGPYTTASYSLWSIGVASCDTNGTYPGSLVLGNGQRISGIGLSGPTFGNTLLRYKLVLAKDAILANGNFSRTPEYIEECQHPEAFDPVIVQRSVVICKFSSGFLNGSSNPTAISNTLRTLRFMGFVLIANPMYGDFLIEPLPFSIPGIMIPITSDSKIILDYYEKQTERDSYSLLVYTTICSNHNVPIFSF
nr:subtilisin-like protease SBT2.4 [Tanacetum cinerariifolium]